MPYTKDDLADGLELAAAFTALSVLVYLTDGRYPNWLAQVLAVIGALAVSWVVGRAVRLWATTLTPGSRPPAAQPGKH